MKKVLALSLALILLLGIMSQGTSSYFSDTETSSGNTLTAWLGCPPGSLIIVSDEDTMVTEVNGTLVDPHQNAVFAWEPCKAYPSCDTGVDDEPSLWDKNTGNYFTGTGADWIWDTRLTSDPAPEAPATGRVVQFERTFEIPCAPIGATLDITVDNGYTVWINGHLVGCSEVDPCIDWWSFDLKEAHVHSDGWSTVKHYSIPASDLVEGTNTLVILAANEYYNTDDGHSGAGTAVTNPAGLIYRLEVEWGDW
jgi:predicted ribosomally synthesized peptide with SipW-like signal peptide